MIGYARMMLHRLRDDSRHARMREHLAIERLPVDELRQRQFWLAMTLLRHAFEVVPYYRALMDERGMRPEDVNNFVEFSRLPVLSRTTLLARMGDLVASTMPRKALLAAECLFEEGRPLHLCRDRAARDETQANWLLCLSFAGWTTADMVVRLYASPGASVSMPRYYPGVREWLSGTLSVDGCCYGPEDVAGWVRTIRRCGRAYLLGGSRVLSDMADYVNEAGIRVRNVRGVVTSGGWPQHEQRLRIANAFGCRAHYMYGCTEVPCIAIECEHGNMHMLTHSAYVEFVPDPCCGVPHVVVTDLNNRAMPLIRYATEDRAVPLAGGCACGRGFPLMQMPPESATWFATADGQFLAGDDLARSLVDAVGEGGYLLRQQAPGRVAVVIRRDGATETTTDDRVRALCRDATGRLYPGVVFSLAYDDETADPTSLQPPSAGTLDCDAAAHDAGRPLPPFPGMGSKGSIS